MTSTAFPGAATDPDRSTTAIGGVPAPGGLSRLADTDLARLLLIRHFELAVLALYDRGKLAGTTHTCLGQEYIPVALAPLLTERDFVLSNHRGHGHYLARFEDPEGLLAELMGREGAVCNGVGGSQHLYRDRYLSTGVQGESLPVAAGVALHLKRQSTPTALQMAGTIAGRAHAFGIEHVATDSFDLNVIRSKLAPLLIRLRRECAPVVVEVATVRVGPHSKGDDTRAPEELRRVREHDWYPRYAAGYPDQFGPLDEAARVRVGRLVREVDARPPAVWADGQPERRG